MDWTSQATRLREGLFLNVPTTVDEGSEDARLACPSCDLVFDVSGLADGETARCSRCGHFLTCYRADELSRVMAFTISALVLLALASSFPFMAFKASGLESVMTLPQTISELWRNGMPDLAFLVAAFIILIPATVLVLVAILVGALFGTINPLLFKINFLIQGTYETADNFRINMLTLAGTRELLGVAFRDHIVSFMMTFSLLMLLWVSRALLRSERWAAVLFVCVYIAGVLGMNQGSRVILFFPAFLHGVVVLILLTRFGTLGLIVCYTVHLLIQTFPLTLDSSTWFFGHGLFAMLLVLLVALGGMAILVNKRPRLTQPRAD